MKLPWLFWINSLQFDARGKRGDLEVRPFQDIPVFGIFHVFGKTRK